MSVPVYTPPPASSERTARGIGQIIFLYVFTHSYFVVGSIRNALGAGPHEGPVRMFALLSGLAWCLLFAGGVLLLLLKRIGLNIAATGAGLLVVVHLAGFVVFRHGGGTEFFNVVLRYSMPVYALFLLILLPRMGRSTDAVQGGKVLPGVLVIAGSALIPWLAALGLWSFGAASATQVSSIRPLIAVFISLWCAIPFAVLLLSVRIWPQQLSRQYALAGGGAATVIASLYVYGLIWFQGGNIFLLALLQPIVFAAQAFGLAIVLVFRRRGIISRPVL